MSSCAAMRSWSANVVWCSNGRGGSDVRHAADGIHVPARHKSHRTGLPAEPFAIISTLRKKDRAKYASNNAEYEFTLGTAQVEVL